MSDQPKQEDFYQIGGMQVDVNPFQQKDSDCNLVLNMYSHTYLAKKVRFGYTKFLDNPDNEPVRNLIFYQFPLTEGILRVSGGNTYQAQFPNNSWGTPLSGGSVWTQDVQLGNTTLAGTVPYVHLSDSVDGYYTFDGTNFVQRNGGFTPKSNYLATYQSRSIGDINALSIAESYIDFDLDLPMAAGGDPFYFDSASADPSQGGTTSANPGNNGRIVGLSTVQNTVLIYRQRSVTRFDGASFIDLSFAGSVVPNSIGTSDYYKINYFLSYNSIYSCDASQVIPISFGVNTVIQDTYEHLGIPTALTFCFDYMSYFWVGNIYYKGEILHNALFVRDERFNEWYIWTIGHTITAFGSYTDANNVRHMITGDNLGNTYVWGEQYSSDDGTPIEYRLRTKYFDNGNPAGSKIPQAQINVSGGASDEAIISAARNYSDNFTPIGTASGFFANFNASGNFRPSYKTISLEISGSTTSQRPEFYGWTIPYDLEERFSNSQSVRSQRG